ncbi:hypothetical protein [Streptomyces californicus]|uniref:hypothetical protein n=1 Tax=Streptomyces californicus TaxID=67351 RepID=UPI00296E4F7C|nr:hypothetical protein [Streptomyces californicus]MDW4912527.1 hypothetical protein [Streptomyces californicus]
MAAEPITTLSRPTLKSVRAVPRSGAACASNVDLFERLGGNGSPNVADQTVAAQVCAACTLGETCAFRVKGGNRR